MGVAPAAQGKVERGRWNGREGTICSKICLANKKALNVKLISADYLVS